MKLRSLKEVTCHPDVGHLELNGLETFNQVIRRQFLPHNLAIYYWEVVRLHQEVPQGKGGTVCRADIFGLLINEVVRGWPKRDKSQPGFNFIHQCRHHYRYPGRVVSEFDTHSIENVANRFCRYSPTAFDKCSAALKRGVEKQVHHYAVPLCSLRQLIIFLPTALSRRGPVYEAATNNGEEPSDERLVSCDPSELHDVAVGFQHTIVTTLIQRPQAIRPDQRHADRRNEPDRRHHSADDQTCSKPLAHARNLPFRVPFVERVAVETMH